MRDGTYKVYLDGGGVKGFVIGTLCEGRITGCDQTHHVIGTVADDGSRVRGSMTMTRHARVEGFTEIADLDLIEVTFSGIGGAVTGEFDARIAGRPELPVTATFQWLCGL